MIWVRCAPLPSPSFCLAAEGLMRDWHMAWLLARRSGFYCGDHTRCNTLQERLDDKDFTQERHASRIHNPLGVPTLFWKMTIALFWSPRIQIFYGMLSSKNFPFFVILCSLLSPPVRNSKSPFLKASWTLYFLQDITFIISVRTWRFWCPKSLCPDVPTWPFRRHWVSTRTL